MKYVASKLSLCDRLVSLLLHECNPFSGGTQRSQKYCSCYSNFTSLHMQPNFMYQIIKNILTENSVSTFFVAAHH